MKKWIIIVFFISSCILSSCGSEKDVLPKDTSEIENNQSEDTAAGNIEKQTENIAPSNNQLGFQLLSTLHKEQKENIVISPLSLFFALSMVTNGADGETKDEIQKVLHTKLETEKLNEQNKTLYDVLNQNSKEIQLKIANSIWLNKRFHLQDDFANNMKNYYQANIETVDITSMETLQKINDWVKGKTNGKIEQIVGDPFDAEVVSVLINAIYFKGQWLHEFDPNLTEKRKFYINEQSTAEVPFMQQQNQWLYFENEMFQAVSLPYRGGNLNMKVILPKKQIKLEDVLKKLTLENWQKWKNEFTVKKGTVLMPKFQLKYETVLNDVLKQLGMKSAFENGANFGKFIKDPDPLWIDQIKQVTYIGVNEEGTEAAAATSVAMTTEAFIDDKPFYMEVNRPFFITISDETTDTILFLGIIQNPSS